MSVATEQTSSQPFSPWGRGFFILVDGFKFYEVTIGISQIPEYLILSMEAPNDPSDLKNAVFPDVFTVDYVRVYKKKGQSH